MAGSETQRALHSAPTPAHQVQVDEVLEDGGLKAGGGQLAGPLPGCYLIPSAGAAGTGSRAALQQAQHGLPRGARHAGVDALAARDTQRLGPRRGAAGQGGHRGDGAHLVPSRQLGLEAQGG